MLIKIKRGLDIPVDGRPEGDIRVLTASGQAAEKMCPQQIALNLWPFEDEKLVLLKKVGDEVKIGEPLCEDRGCPGRMFVSPAGGIIKDVRRGLKRRLHDVIIDLAKEEVYVHHTPLLPTTATRQEIIDRLLAGGMFSKIRQRPFNVLADPKKTPKSIFVKAIESAPYAVPAEMHVKGHESEFQTGLDALAKLTNGKVHLVYSQSSTCQAFMHAKNVEKHTAEGPHPIGTHSLHIQKIDPIRSPEDVLWTLNSYDVVAIGRLLSEGKYYHERIVSIAGSGVLPGQTGYFRVREGFPIASLVVGRIPKQPLRFVSGDPLMGSKVSIEDFLGYYHYALCIIPEVFHRELLHFFRLGLHKYSFTRAYLSGHLNNSHREYPFTTLQHGERRAFIDGSLYDEIMPLDIPTMQLVKAIMAEDYDLAEELGLLEVDPEDFALATFVCPSKIEMTDIVKGGIKAHAAEMLQ